MPFGMSGYVQSVVMQGRVYIGGGDAGRSSANNFLVMEYDTCSGEWATLPAYKASDFAMTEIRNQLVLVGGSQNGDESKVLGVWRADQKTWTLPYPDMPTARSRCSVVVYNDWLVVAGGWADGRPLSCVEVLNTNSRGQWHAGPPTPRPWYNTKTAIIGDKGYFMGGHDSSGSAFKNVYQVNIQALTQHVTSKEFSELGQQVWQEIPRLQVTRSTPLSVGESLLAVGGLDKERKSVTAIHLYKPDAAEWVKVGDLPFPRYHSMCGMVTERDMVVAGGFLNDRLKGFDIALIHTP